MERKKFEIGIIKEPSGQYSSYVTSGHSPLYYEHIVDYRDAMKALEALAKQAKSGFGPDTEVTFERRDYFVPN